MISRAFYFGRLHAISFILGVAMASPAASADVCDFPEPREVQVSVSRLDGDVVYNNTRSREALRQMQRQSGRAQAFGRAWTPVGLTLTELKYQMRLKVEAIAVTKRTYCARLTSVDAELGYDKLKVYIARKFRPGTCAYRSISDHELTHVAVFRDALETFYPRLQRRLQRAARQLDPVRAGSPDAAATYMRKRLAATIQPLFLEMNRELDRNNARLDTPERYRREQAMCAEW